MDWDAILSQNQAALGSEATLTLNGLGGMQIALSAAVDDTKGVTLDPGTEVETIAPVVRIMRADLGDIDLAELRDATLSINGTTWTVRSHRTMPSPGGLSTGQIWLILRES